MTDIPYLGIFFSHGTPVWPWPVIIIYATILVYMNIRERPTIVYTIACVLYL